MKPDIDKILKRIELFAAEQKGNGELIRELRLAQNQTDEQMKKTDNKI